MIGFGTYPLTDQLPDPQPYETCDRWMQFNFSELAGLLSQMSGVLAGFAFVAITIVLSREHRRDNDLPRKDAWDRSLEKHEDSAFISAAGCALVGLILTTALYATIAAQEGCVAVAGAQASAEVLAGVAFAFSVYTLLSSLVQLVSVAPVGAHLRFIVAVIAPPAVLLFVVASLGDLALSAADPPKTPMPTPPERPPIPGHDTPTIPRGTLQPTWVSQADESFWEWSRLASWVIPTLVFCVCALVFAVVQWRRRGMEPPRREERFGWMFTARTFLPYASLVLVLYSIGRFLTFSTLGPASHIGAEEAWALVAFSVGVLVVQSAFLSLLNDTHPTVAIGGS